MSFIINPYSFSTGAALVLDDFTADLAFSTRKLRTAYSGYCMKVRRTSDNTTLEVGFVDGYIDTASMSSFGSGTTLTIVTWYDQSGNGNNLYQSTANEQPVIYSGGAFKTAGGKLGLSVGTVAESDDDMLLTTAITSMASGATCYNVAKRPSTGQYGIVLAAEAANAVYLGLESIDGYFYGANTNYVFQVSDATTTHNLWTVRVPNSGVTPAALIHKNGVNKTYTNIPVSRSVNFNNMGNRNGSHSQGVQNEYILFLSQQSDADVTTIETDIIAYYGL